MPRIREVRKRDNRIVPFDQTKIGDAIHKAIRSVGSGDRALADDLASAVTLFLEKKFAGGIPSIEDIQDMVETVLRETGHGEIAAAYVEYRKKRSKIREILRVHKESAEGPQVEPGSRQTAAPWSKAKIVAALVKEADLEAGIAGEIAAAVEEKVLRSGLSRISTTLIRELVDNELFERGYAAKLKRQAPIGFPKYNLEQVLFSADAKEPYSFIKDPEDTELLVARHVLRQYALEEIFSSEVGEASRDRRIHIHRLGEPLRLYRVRIPSHQDFFDEDGVTLRFLRTLRAVGSEIAVPFPPARPLLRTLGSLCFRSRAIAVCVDRATQLPPVPGQDDPAAMLSYDISLDPLYPFPRFLVQDAASYYVNERRVGFTIERGPRSPLVPAKVSLNVPQIAFRSARSRLGDIFAEIDRALALALKALLERRSFLVRASRASDLPLGDVLGRDGGIFDLADASFAIGVFGVADAVKFVTGKEAPADGDGIALTIHIVRHLAQKIAREERGLGIRLHLEETMDPRLLIETAGYDAQRFPEFKEVVRGRSPPPVYTAGVRLPDHSPLDPLTRNQYLAEMFPFMVLASLVGEDRELRAGGEEALVSLLEESMPYFASKLGGPAHEPAEGVRSAGPAARSGAPPGEP